MRIHAGLFILLITLIFSISLSAQRNDDYGNSPHKLGLLSGMGSQMDLLKVDYEYRVLFFQLQYSYLLWNNPVYSFELISQPQINSTVTHSTDLKSGEERGFEVGLNFGLLFRKKFSKGNVHLYGIAGTGPHFISATLRRQASGFLFANYFALGINVRLFKNIYIDLRPGFRHISNAGIKNPNGGINNLLLRAGIAFPI